MTDQALQPAVAMTDEAILQQPAADVTNQVDSPWLAYSIQAMITLLVVGTVLSLYHFLYVIPNRQKVALIDVSEVLELKQMQLATDAAKPGITDKERAEIFDKIGTFSKDLEVAIDELQSECDCTLLVRAAVVKSRGDDLTHDLKVRLGLGDLKPSEMVKRLRSLPSEVPKIPEIK